ncbi:hypothetical protein [Micromonospora tulbaghiae]
MNAMVAAYIRIAPLGAATPIEPLVLRDLLYAQTVAASRVEHIRIRAGPHTVDVIAFIDSDDVEEAIDTLHRLVSSAIATTPQLRPWRIV